MVERIREFGWPEVPRRRAVAVRAGVDLTGDSFVRAWIQRNAHSPDPCISLEGQSWLFLQSYVA